MRPDGRRHTFADIYHERTNFDFMGRKSRWALISGVLVLIGILGFVFNSLNLGIDFEGGTQWQLTTSGTTPTADGARAALRSLGHADAKILIIGNRQLRVQTESLPEQEQTKVTEALAKYGNVTPDQISLNDVGPTWGKQVSSKALRALIVFFIVIALYLTMRFEWKMALSAIAAVVHDIVITIGVYAVFGFEVTPATVIAFLTILGFSLYDTVVVFDKIKENTPTVAATRGDSYGDMVNRSMNDVLMRSLNTSFVALLPVASLLIVGSWYLKAISLREFGLALFVGLLTGAYSSIFVATPILAVWKERESRYRVLRERRTARGPADAAPPAMAGVGVGARETAPAPPSPAPFSSTTTRAPRPRQQRRRKR